MHTRFHSSPPEAPNTDARMLSSPVVQRTVSLVSLETGKSEKFIIIVGAPSPRCGRVTVSESEALERTIDDARLIFEKLLENGTVSASGGTTTKG